MPVVLACPNGHQWELPDGPAAVGPLRCPVCAAQVDPPLVSIKPTEESETLPGRAQPEGAVGATGPSSSGPRTGPLPQLPGYEIIAEVGRGGMGVVYQARHTRLDRLVAIKMLPTEAGRDSHFVERFTREARALARLSHPGIIAVHDFGQDAEQYYFVMEFVTGTDLRQRLRSGRLPPAEVFRIVGQICDALQYAHDEGIVHRDIKPENILLDRRDRVKIADFGIAKLLTHNTGQYTLTGPLQLVGTWRYMAPEQLEDPQGLDHRADIYSLGVVLYEMLTGKLPVGQFPPASQVAAVDRRVDELLVRALQREPELRFQKVGELKAALDALAGAMPVAAPSGQSPAERSAAVGPAATTLFEQAPEIPKEVRGKIDSASRALRIAGVLSWLVAWPALGLAFLPVDKMTVVTRMTVVTGALLAVLGGMMLQGAHDAARLRRYRSAILRSVLPILPISPLWPITFCLGFWSFTRLRHPQVQRAFEAQGEWEALHPPSPGPVHRFLAHSAGWVMLVCAAGIVLCMQPVLPWCTMRRGTEAIADGYGYQSFAGIVPAALLLGYMVVLIVTGFEERETLWGPLVRMMVGLVVFLFPAYVILGETTADHHTYVDTTGYPIRLHFRMLNRDYTVPGPWADNVGDYLSVQTEVAAYLVSIVGLTLLLLGSVQLRGVVRRYRPAPAQARRADTSQVNGT